MQHRPRQFNGAGSAVFREARHRGAPRIAFAQKLRGLIKGFARGIIKRLPEKLIVPEGRHLHKLRVASGNEKRQKRKLRFFGAQ